MKIVHVISGLRGGGAEGVMVQLIKASNYEHIVVSLSAGGIHEKNLKAMGVETYIYPLNAMNFVFETFKLLRLIRLLRADVIQTWMYHGDLVGSIASLLAGNRNIVWNVRHSDLVTDHVGIQIKAVSLACKFLSAFIPRKIIYVSAEAQSAHLKFGYRKGIGKVIPNGIELDELLPVPAHSIHEATGHSIIQIGMVARYNKQKNHIGLLKALKLVEISNYKYHLQLFGITSEKDQASLMAISKELGLNTQIAFRGYVEDKHEIYNSLDILVLPSTSGEGFPNVLAEAMAFGVPCVATDCGAAKQIINSFGWIATSHRPESIKEALLNAMHEFYFRQNIFNERVVNGMKYIRTHYPLKQMVNRYERVWREII